MLSCKQAAEACSAEMEQPLGWRQRASLGVHLMMCTGCRNYRDQLLTLREAMQAYAAGRAPGDADVPQRPE